MHKPLLRCASVALCATLALPAETVYTGTATEKVDLLTINRIKSEAFQNSKVMDDMFYLTDVYGPRLAGSPNYMAAAEWAVKTLKDMGLQNAHLEKWGPFGKGWTYTHYEGHMLAPAYAPLIGVPMAWTSGTNGSVTGEVVFAPLKNDGDLEKQKGKLKGKIVLISDPRQLNMATEALGKRSSEADLEKLANVDEVAGGSALANMSPEQRERIRTMRGFNRKLAKFLSEEQPAAALMISTRGDGGTVFAQGFGGREEKDPIPPPVVALTPEHYNRMVRLIEKKIPVKVEFNIEAKFITDTKDSVNVIAEIPGTTKKDEIVMLGGHLDSWQGGTGATDNAAGCAVAIEAVRIMQALNLKPARTIRIALWGGEEQGLLGSRAYVKEHFADPETMHPTSEHAKVSGYFNLDNGTGKIRGIYLQENDMMRPIAEAWLEPFKDLGAKTISIRNTGGTDHLSFNSVGIPGFQFIQDPMEYETRTHHSNMDNYDHIQPSDLRQASAIMASFVYNAAMRSEMLPRKPLPKPQPSMERMLDGGDNKQPQASPATEQPKRETTRPLPTAGGSSH